MAVDGAPTSMGDSSCCYRGRAARREAVPAPAAHLGPRAEAMRWGPLRVSLTFLARLIATEGAMDFGEEAEM